MLGGGAKSRKELQQMFMKIDANSDGTVDWDEFTNFILLETVGLSHDEDVYFFKPCEIKHAPRSILTHGMSSYQARKAAREAAKQPLSGRQGMIDCIICASMDKKRVYVTGSRDGGVRVWSASTKQQLKHV